MKAIPYLAAPLLIGGLASANTNGEPGSENGPLLEEGEGAVPELALEGEEYSGLLPTSFKTLFQSRNAEVTWGGRLFFDLGFFTADSSYVDDAGGIGGDGAEFRTARFYAKGRLHDSVDFKTQIEFAPNGENNFKDVYMGMGTPFGKVKVGHFKEAFSLEQLTSSRFITFMERSLGDVFTPGRNIGIELSGYEEGLNDLNWAFGVFRNSTDGARSVNDGQYNFTGRLTSTAFNENDSSSVLHYGAAVSYRDNAGMTKLTDEPEVHLLADLGGTAGLMNESIASDGVMHYNAEMAWIDGPVSLQAEYFMASVDAAIGGVDADYSGYYAFGSYFLTGEMRNYEAKGGKFGRVRVANNYDGSGGSGALELKARVSSRDFNDGPTTNETMNFSAGLNWYLNSHTRIMFDYIHSNYEDGAIDDSLDGVMIRFQTDF